MLDTLKRYFVANRARIFSVRRIFSQPIEGFTPFRVGNAMGFFWGRWEVSWRMPYSKVWAFDGTRWVHAYTLSSHALP